MLTSYLIANKSNVQLNVRPSVWPYIFF